MFLISSIYYGKVSKIENQLLLTEQALLLRFYTVQNLVWCGERKKE
jgi:hypothetical protein